MHAERNKYDRFNNFIEMILKTSEIVLFTRATLGSSLVSIIGVKPLFFVIALMSFGLPAKRKSYFEIQQMVFLHSTAVLHFICKQGKGTTLTG